MAKYFDERTDEALAEFIYSEDVKTKHLIFDKRIRPSFEKLIESLIFVYKFYGVDELESLKRDCLSVLYETIPRFDPKKGTKGFSYFNVIAKNWFIAKNKEKQNRQRIESELHVDIEHDSLKNDPMFVIGPFEEDVQLKERWIKFYEAMDSWKVKLAKKTEVQLLEAIVFLMRNPDLVTIYSRKAVFIYLRDLTGQNAKQLVTNLKRVKELYDRWNEDYLATGEP